MYHYNTYKHLLILPYMECQNHLHVYMGLVFLYLYTLTPFSLPPLDLVILVSLDNSDLNLTFK